MWDLTREIRELRFGCSLHIMQIAMRMLKSGSETVPPARGLHPAMTADRIIALVRSPCLDITSDS